MKSIHTIRYASIIIVAAMFFMACNASPEKDHKLPAAETTDMHQEHEAASKLVLNNGAKWKSDSSTNKNVSALNAIVMEKKPVTADEYKATANTMQAGIDKMVKECRMQGADHEALHHWLEPLMEDNKKLSEFKSLPEAAGKFEELKKQLSLYTQFFE